MRDFDRSDGGDVSCEGETQGAGSQVPYLDGPVGAPRDEPVIAGIYVNTADPPQMSADHSVELPRCMPDRL